MKLNGHFIRTYLEQFGIDKNSKIKLRTEIKPNFFPNDMLHHTDVLIINKQKKIWNRVKIFHDNPFAKYDNKPFTFNDFEYIATIHSGEISFLHSYYLLDLNCTRNQWKRVNNFHLYNDRSQQRLITNIEPHLISTNRTISFDLLLKQLL